MNADNKIMIELADWLLEKVEVSSVSKEDVSSKMKELMSKYFEHAKEDAEIIEERLGNTPKGEN